MLEARFGSLEAVSRCREYRRVHHRFAGLIARINSVANHCRKGRGDLGPDVLMAAQRVLRECDAAAGQGGLTDELRAARLLASGVVASFDALRGYLHRVRYRMEHVHSQLCNNAELVKRLVSWEENWEIGSRFVQRRPILAAVGDAVAQLRRARQLVPGFAAMCSELDAELFLILPRMLWLCFLRCPARQTDLLRGMLPHHFDSWDAPAEAWPWSVALAG